MPSSKHILSPRGRINRRTFLLSTLILWGTALVFVHPIFTMMNCPWNEPVKFISIAGLLVGTALLYWINIMIAVKRLHDIGCSGRWGIFIFLMPVFSYGMARSGIWIKDDSGIWGMICLFGSLAGSLESAALFILPGKKGANRFGEEPGGSKESKKTSSIRKIDKSIS